MKRIFAIILSFVLLVIFVFDASAVGKRVVKEDESVSVSKFTVTAEEQKNLDSLPIDVKAKAVVLMDVSTGKILLEHNPDLKLYPASVTKIMTILLVAEAVDSKKISLTDKVTCSQNAASKGGSQIWLEVGESMTVDELLRATVIGSANDAATLLGEYVSGSETAFVDAMNTRAKELKMTNTHFENATGLDDDTKSHLTTARDIAIMSRELLKHPFIKNYSTLWMDSLRNGKTELVNTNRLVRFYSGTTGIKTGTTAKAGCCISASAQRDNLHLVAVVLGSNNSTDRFETAKAMLDWGFSNFMSYQPVINKKQIKDVSVLNGRESCVKVKIPKISPLLIKKGEEQSVKVKVELCSEVSAPVIENQTLGTVKILLNNKVVTRYKLCADTSVEKLTYPDTLRIIANYLGNGVSVYN